MAEKLLIADGYAIVERQVPGRAHVIVDGKRIEAALRADLLVERGGGRFLVEVKTGAQRAPESSDTRRQLLEYAAAFRVDGILLVDAEQKRICAVSFDYFD